MTSSVHHPLSHDSAGKHVRGEAVYLDDMEEPARLLHACIGLSDRAHAKVMRLDLAKVAAAPGVVAVIAAGDLPAGNDIGPVFPGDPIFAAIEVEYWGQSLFAVAAESRDAARRAAALAEVTYQDLPAVIEAQEDYLVLPSRVLKRGDSARALASAPNRIEGRISMGGQDHFYLEGQIAMAIPGEDGDMQVFSSTQNPTEIQHMVAKCLGLADHAVTCEVRRMGGAFGGKETQANLFAVVAALLARKTGRPVKIRPDRDDDMILTGKRHDFRVDYAIGFDARGVVTAAEFTLAARCGMSPDLSAAVCGRAMTHVDNCYFLENVTVTSHRCKTHTVSNTAFRGFGGPQGMLAIETALDHVARHLGLDPLEVRRRNLYGKRERNLTPYGMKVEDNVAPDLIAELARRGDYAARRKSIAEFNRGNPWIKKGIALTPVKFGIAFNVKHLNQAGALVHIYTDGSVQLNHGGTEMGQGLFVKVAQVVAEEFGLSIDRVKTTATHTGKVPNTSPTAGSTGSDINGKAAQAAARSIRRRLAKVAAELWGVATDEIVFSGGAVRSGNHVIPFPELCRKAYLQRVQLSATGFYKTPKLHWDDAKFQGRPYHYFAYGAALSEVAVDVLTGEHRVLRVDILHDCGKSLNPAIDLGQIEGAFVQGMGWLTTEELVWDKEGRLKTHAPSTYKIPACSDVPEDFRVGFLDRPNREDTIFRSKAVGEPPFPLAISVFNALKDAIAACGAGIPELDAPATPERVLRAIERQKGTAE